MLLDPPKYQDSQFWTGKKRQQSHVKSRCGVVLGQQGPLHHFLRALFLAALFCVRAFLLHLSKRLCHVFDLMPNFKAYIDRGTLRSRHSDTIAGPRVDLDDLLLVQFVLHTEDKPCIVNAELEFVDDCPFDLRSERSQDVRYQIVGKRPFLLRALHEHRDRRPNALIDEDYESLFLVAKKNGEAAAGRSYGTDVHFDNGLTHTASFFSPSRQDPSAPLATQRLFPSVIGTSSIMFDRYIGVKVSAAGPLFLRISFWLAFVGRSSSNIRPRLP